MIDFSLVKFVLFVIFIVQSSSSSHEIKITKCLKTPDTWKKVYNAIKECQEDVKLKIVKDAFQSINDDWDYSIFDHDDHVPLDLNQHEQHPLIHDHLSSVHDHHASIHDHHPPTLDHHSSIHDHHPSIHDHHPSIQDHHPSIHDQQSSIHDHHHSIHDHHPPIHDHHPPSHDYYPGTNEQLPSEHNEQSSIHDHRSPKFHSTHPHSSFPYHVENHSPLPHDHPLLQKSHDAHQVEAPQLKIPQRFVPSAHHDTHIKAHPHTEHVVEHTDSLSDNPVEPHQHIDFNDFRKKRDAHDHGWIHPSTVTYHDKRIAGCIMQCIYEKNHAVDQLGWPTLDGLVNFYSEGVNEHGYFMATLRAVDYCLKGSSAKYHVNRRSTPENGQTCDVAFDVFDCISDRITEYCSDHHPDSNYIKL